MFEWLSTMYPLEAIRQSAYDFPDFIATTASGREGYEVKYVSRPDLADLPVALVRAKLRLYTDERLPINLVLVVRTREDVSRVMKSIWSSPKSPGMRVLIGVIEHGVFLLLATLNES